MGAKDGREVRQGLEELQVIVAFGAQRFGPESPRRGLSASGALSRSCPGGLRCEVTEGSVEDDHVVARAWKAFVRRVEDGIADVRSGVPATACAMAPVDVDRIHMSASWSEEPLREEAVAAADVQNHLALADHLRGEEAPEVGIGVTGSGRESEASDPVVEVVRELGSEYPLTPKDALVVPAQQADQQTLTSLPTPEHVFHGAGESTAQTVHG